LIDVYENAIKDFKAELEKEYNKQSSDNNRIRTYLVSGAYGADVHCIYPDHVFYKGGIYL
jgi:hypothetical protein